MPAVLDAAFVDRLAAGSGHSVAVDGSAVAVFKVDGAFHAVEAWCLRCGANLAQASIVGRIVTCGGCQWRYDVCDGSVIGIPALRLAIFNVKADGGGIVISHA